jgi:hypothetical protein
MPDYKKVLYPETERTFSGSALTTSYQAIGTPIAHASAQMLWLNNTGVLVKVSYDGTNDHFTLLAGAEFMDDENANAVASSEAKAPSQTQFYVKLAPGGTAGADKIYFSTWYLK